MPDGRSETDPGRGRSAAADQLERARVNSPMGVLPEPASKRNGANQQQAAYIPGAPTGGTHASAFRVGLTMDDQKFEPISPTPAYQLVAEAIEREIVTGRLRPGEPIGTEAQLVRQLGASRSTIREGIRLLEQSGLIHRDQGRRLLVGRPDDSRLVTRISRALILHEVTFRELWHAAIAVELAIVEQAVVHVSDDILAELEANIAATEAAGADAAAIAHLDAKFHGLIARASCNRVLLLQQEPTNLLVSPTTELILRKVKEGVPRLIHAHRMYVDALRRRDLDAARLWVRRHLVDWRRGFEFAGNDLDEPIGRTYRELSPEEDVRRRRKPAAGRLRPAFS